MPNGHDDYDDENDYDEKFNLMKLANAIIETMMRGVICDGAGGTEVFLLSFPLFVIIICRVILIIIIIVTLIIRYEGFTSGLPAKTKG